MKNTEGALGRAEQRPSGPRHSRGAPTGTQKQGRPHLRATLKPRLGGEAMSWGFLCGSDFPGTEEWTQDPRYSKNKCKLPRGQPLTRRVRIRHRDTDTEPQA